MDKYNRHINIYIDMTYIIDIYRHIYIDYRHNGHIYIYHNSPSKNMFYLSCTWHSRNYCRVFSVSSFRLLCSMQPTHGRSVQEFLTLAHTPFFPTPSASYSALPKWNLDRTFQWIHCWAQRLHNIHVAKFCVCVDT